MAKTVIEGNPFTETALDLVIQHQALEIERELQWVHRQHSVEVHCELARLAAQRAHLIAQKIFLARCGGCLPQT